MYQIDKDYQSTEKALPENENNNTYKVEQVKGHS